MESPTSADKSKEIVSTPPPQEKELSFEEKQFEKAAKKVKAEGYQLMEANHDLGGEDPKEYHTSEHPHSLEPRADRMADIFHSPHHKRELTNIYISFHDTIIEYKHADPKNIVGMIQRRRGAREGDPSGSGGNEALSGQKMAEEMRRANEEAGREIFSEESIQTGIFAIDATYPGVDFGPDFKGAPFEKYPQYKTIIEENPAAKETIDMLKGRGIERGPLFFQPHLESALERGEKVPTEVLITALADLGAAGIEGRSKFFAEGDAEFRELYENIRKPENLSRLLEGDGDADREDRAKVVGAMTSWLQSQPGFAAWQMLRFEKIVHLLKQNGEIDSAKEEGLRKMFEHYPDNVKSTLERVDSRKKDYERIKELGGEKQAFAYLAKEMGYKK